MHASIHVCACCCVACVSVCECVCVSVCVCAYVLISCMCICVYVYKHIYVCFLSVYDSLIHLAAMTGIHGVSSSLWLPMIQSKSGNRLSADGVIGLSWNM